MREYYYTPLSADNRPAIIGRCLDTIRSGRKVIYIAPSREIIFAVRKSLADGLGGIMGAFVGGFDDLEAELMRGSSARGRVIDGETALAVLSAVCRAAKETLACFAAVAELPGFGAELYRVIKRLKRMGLTPEVFAAQLAAIEGGLDAALERKVRDVLALYAAYQAFLAEKDLLDIDEISLLAVEAVKDSSFLADAALVVVDGYSNIDPVNRELLRAIGAAYPELAMLGNVPFRTEQNEPFLAEEIIRDLTGLRFTAAAGTPESAVPDLQRLAQNLFSPAGVRLDRCAGLSIQGAPSREDEVRQAAHRVKRLLCEDGEPPAEIAVVLGSFAEYQEDVLRVFEEMGIPVNLGRHEPLARTPLYKDFASFLGLKIRPLDGERLISTVASRYFPFADASGDGALVADLLDKLSRRAGAAPDIDALLAVLKEWQEQRVWAEYGVGDAAVSRVLAILRLIRNYLTALPEEASLGACLAAAGAALESLDCEGQLLARYRDGKLPADLLLRDLRAVAAVKAMFAELRKIFGLIDSEDHPAPFSAVLTTLAEAAGRRTVIWRRPAPAGVKVLNPDLVRGVRYRHVFFLGLNEGLFPRAPHRSGLFSPPEREKLAARGWRFDHYDWELQRELLRCGAVCAAGATLHLSYRTADEDGKYMIKSSCLEEVLRLLSPAARTAAVASARSMRQRFDCDAAAVWSACEAREIATVALWQKTRAEAERLQPYVAGVIRRVGAEEFQRLRQAGLMELSRSLAPDPDEFDGYIPGRELRQQQAEYRFSASQLNSYVNCPYRYYLERVLGVSEDEEDTDLTPRSEGAICHAALKRYYEAAPEPDAPDGELLAEIVRDTFRAAVRTPLDTLLLRAKEAEIRRDLADFLTQDATYLANYRAVTGRRLRPVYFERSVNAAQSFDGRRFTAKIDRVDLEYDGAAPTGRFVIYDYKRGGSKRFRECVEGEDYQLLIYYHCFLETLRREKTLAKPECIALYYYSIKNKKKDGFVRSDYQKALGDARKQNTVSPAVFVSLMRILKERAMRLVGKIERGEFGPPPECKTGFFGCDYAGVCRHDPYRLAAKREVKA